MEKPGEKSPAKEERKAGGMGRTFTKEILVPIVLALVVIQFVIQAFKIPSASMEDSLLIGDFLLGLKFVYGSPIPFADKKLPGLTDPKPGDVLIFRYPGDPSYPEDKPGRYRFLANLFLFGNLYWDRTPAPNQKHIVWYQPKDFIKRAVAQSGQTITVSGKRLLIDGKESVLPPKGKHLSERGYEPQRDTLHYRIPAPGETLDFDTLSLKEAVWMRSLAYQENPGKRVELQLDLVKDSVVDNGYVLPYLRAPYTGLWRNMYALMDQLLRLREMQEGDIPYFQVENLPFKVIQDAARSGFIRTNDLPGFRMPAGPENPAEPPPGRRLENNEYFFGCYLDLINANVAGQGEAAGGHWRIKPSLVIDGRPAHTYTVRHKAYFMMGDNRDNSSDSRYWGLLSKDFVKAKAFIIYFSLADDNGEIKLLNPFTWLLVPAKIRYGRVGKLIN